MSDQKNLSYFSLWDIDQQVDFTEITVPTGGDTVLYTFTHQNFPEYHLQFRPYDAPTKWFEPGKGSVDNTLFETFDFHTYIENKVLHIVVLAGGTVRLYVYGDKIDHV